MKFIAGAMLGAMFGVSVMCLLAIAKEGDK